MRSKFLLTFGFIFIFLFFSCIKDKAGKQTHHIELEDTIVLSGHSKRSYIFPQKAFIYSKPDTHSIIDTLIAGSVFMIDTAHTYIVTNDMEEYRVGSYIKDGITKKGYIRLYDLSASYVISPFDSNQLFLVGFIPEDTLNNYSSQIKCFRSDRPHESYTMGKKFYPAELGLELNYLKNISSKDNIFLNVCHSWSGCGSSADNYLFCYNSTLNFITDSRWSSYDLVIDYETEVYLSVNTKDKPEKVEDGIFQEETYNKALDEYKSTGGFLIKRGKETHVVKYNEKKGYTDIKEHVFYDLIYSLENGKTSLLDSISYDTSLTEVTRIYY